MGDLSERLSPAFVEAGFKREMEGDAGASWVDKIVSRPYPVSAAERIFVDLFDVDPVAENLDLNTARDLLDRSITIRNVEYSQPLKVFDAILRRDTAGQVMDRIKDAVRRWREHPAKLLSTLLVNGPSAAHWSGDNSQFFFDTQHADGDSGQQSNIVSVDISGLPIPADRQGTITVPSGETMAWAILRAAEQFATLVDTAGEPMFDPSRFMKVHPDPVPLVVLVPTTMMAAATIASQEDRFPEGGSNFLRGYNLIVAANQRLNSWTDKFAVIIGDGKAFLRIQERAPFLSSYLGRGTDSYEQNGEQHSWIHRGTYSLGYGRWERAMLVDLD